MVFGTPKSNQDWGWSRTIKHRLLFYMYILSDTILPCNVSIQRSGINLWHYSTLLHNCKGRVKCWILDFKASCKKKINTCTDMLVYFYKSVLYSITVTGVSCHWKIKHLIEIILLLHFGLLSSQKLNEVSFSVQNLFDVCCQCCKHPYC